ncbi:hypothetical protein DICA3_F24168 [Diutina catenulata]
MTSFTTVPSTNRYKYLHLLSVSIIMNMISLLLLISVALADDTLEVKDGTTYIRIKPEDFNEFATGVLSDSSAVSAAADYYSRMYSFFSGRVPVDSATSTDIDPSFASELGITESISPAEATGEDKDEDSNGVGVNSVAGLVYGVAAAGAGLLLL